MFSFVIAGLSVLSLVTLLWLGSLKIKDASIMDPFWGFGFVLLAWLYFGLERQPGLTVRSVTVPLLVTIWGLRLTVYLLLRRRGKGEDFRYRRWREDQGEDWWWRSYFQVFLLQGTLMWLISLPLLNAQLSISAGSHLAFVVVGVIFWLVGFTFEIVGDWQLAQFKANPANRGRVLQTGLWRYTRHPNYFGEALLWWGFGLLGSGPPLGWWPLFSPAVMTFLLLRVSGVSLLEKSLAEKEDYRKYQQTTSAFFPWFPDEK